LWHHDFRGAPVLRHTLDECDQFAYLRGIVWNLEAGRRKPPAAGSPMVEYDAMCRGHLDELGMTLDEAKRIVYPEPERLPEDFRRYNRIPRTWARPQRQRMRRSAAGGACERDAFWGTP